MIKLSHSSITKYNECAKAYEYSYKQKLRSKSKGSALYFGVANDEMLNYVLLNKDMPKEELTKKALRIFDENWEQGKDNEYNIIDLPKNENILYSKYDFDGDLLEKEDWKELFGMCSNPAQFRYAIVGKLKEKDFHQLESEEKMFYNFEAWLSLKRKVRFMLEAYIDQILPQIAEVIEIQKSVEIEDEEGNKITGIVDAIVRLVDGRVVILDNKTSSITYEADSVITSPQLSLYMTVLNNYVADPDHEWKHYIDACGFAVVSKKLTKDEVKVCKSCGFKGEGSHKTCNNEIDGKRCGGEWDKVKSFKAETQFIVDEIPGNVQDMIIQNYDEVRKAIESDIFPRNFNACKNKYGGKCEFFNLCYNGDMHNLVKVEKK